MSLFYFFSTKIMDDMGGKFECKPWLELAYWQENKTENSFKMQFLIKVIFLKINLISKCQIFHKLHFRHFGSTLFVFKLFHSIFYSCFYLLHVYTISISPGKHFSIFRSLSQSSKEKKLWNNIQNQMVSEQNLVTFLCILRFIHIII